MTQAHTKPTNAPHTQVTRIRVIVKFLPKRGSGTWGGVRFKRSSKGGAGVDTLQRIKAPVARLRHIALARVPIKGSIPEITHRLDALQFTTLAGFQDWQAQHVEMLSEWDQEERALEASASRPWFTVAGHCAICDRDVRFNGYTDVVDPTGRLNWRELLSCPRCKMCNRVRAALHLCVQDFGLTRDSRVYTTEQLGRVYRWLKGHVDDVQGSEYISPEKPSGAHTLGITHQDIQALSLPPESVDFVISFDVLEHVPDHHAALESFAKVLAPGGRLVMTVPFHVNEQDTTVRAVMRDGQIEHLLPIEVHGNPLDPAGSLSFRTFGWDTLEQIKQAGFAEASVVVYHDRTLGHLGGVQSLITAVKG